MCNRASDISRNIISSRSKYFLLGTTAKIYSECGNLPKDSPKGKKKIAKNVYNMSKGFRLSGQIAGRLLMMMIIPLNSRARKGARRGFPLRIFHVNMAIF